MCSIALTVALLAPAAAQAQNTCHVNSLADDGGATTLRALIADPTCALVDFSIQGTITLSDGPLIVDRNLTITGPGPNLLTVRRSDAASSPFFPIFAIGATYPETVPPTVGIHGLTITNGSAVDGGIGGGIANAGTLTLNNSVVSGNSASYGGGIYTEGTLTLTNSVVSGNSAHRSVEGRGGIAGGIFSYLDAPLTLIDSTVSDNSDDVGIGGIYSVGSVTLINSTVSGNSGGGAAALSATLTNTTVSGNNGGGVGAVTLTLTNSTVSGNGIGGIFADALTLTNSTVFDNGAGIGYGTANIKNSLVANNVDGNCFPVENAINIGGANFATDGTCPGFTQVTSAELNLGALDNNGGATQTHALLPGSVAIDAATDCTDWDGHAVATDQRGVGRPRGAACDAGAYELEQGPVFGGFLAPIANSPTANYMKAGQAIAVKFSLGGDFGLNIFGSGSPVSQQTACNPSPSTSTITETLTAGKSSLTYDSATQTYSYVWKTDKAWASTCRRLTVVFNDVNLATQTVDFTFTK